MSKSYTVKLGDSLSKIALQEYGDISYWQDIAYMNSLKAPYVIKPGQVLQIPDKEAGPLDIEITHGTAAPESEPTKNALTPATIALALGVAVALLLDD